MGPPDCACLGSIKARGRGLDFALAACAPSGICCSMFTEPLRREDSNHDQNPDDGHPGHRSLSSLGVVQRTYDVNPGSVDPAPLPASEIAEQMWLVDYPRNEMVASCKTCGQVLRFRTHRLIAEYGRKERIGNVLASKAQTCEHGKASPCELTLIGSPI